MSILNKKPTRLTEPEAGQPPSCNHPLCLSVCLFVLYLCAYMCMLRVFICMVCLYSSLEAMNFVYSKNASSASPVFYENDIYDERIIVSVYA